MAWAWDKRIGGVLLTFPLLNGIAMLAGADPVGIAGTVYLVVMWNCALFLLIIHRFDTLPSLPADLNAEAKIVLRVAAWVLLWAAGSTLLARYRDALSSALWLFVIQLVVVTWYIWRWWRPPRPASLPTFRGMWLTSSGAIRVACFVVAFALLAAIGYWGHDSRWVGWASALPLPGFFALATLTVTQDKRDIASLGDTVLLGPLLAIPFNGLLARAIVHLRVAQAGTLAEVATVMVFWTVAAAAVFFLVPLFTRWRDSLGTTA